MSMESGRAPVRIGVMGCSDFATRKMLAAVGRASGAVLVAVSSRSPERAGRVAARFAADPVVGYEKLLERADVDAVYIPLPNGLHAPWIYRALHAGKHVLAEKPLTTDMAMADELVSLADVKRLVLAENVIFPYHSQHARVRALIDQGVIGRIRGVSATFTIPPRDPGDIRYQAALGGGALLDLGVYPIGTAQMLLGEGVTVVGASLRFEAGVDVSGAALLRREDGVTAHLSFGMEHEYLARYEVHGSVGRIVVNRAFTPDPASQPDVTVMRGGTVEHVAWPADDQYVNAVEAFCLRVQESAVEPDLAIVERARMLAALRDVSGSEPVALTRVSG